MKKAIFWRASALFIVALVVSMAMGQILNRFVERWDVSCANPQGQVREESMMFFYSFEAAREWAVSWAVIDSTLTCRIETVWRWPEIEDRLSLHR